MLEKLFNKSVHSFLYPSVKLLHLSPSPSSQEGNISEGSNALPLGYSGPCCNRAYLCLFSASLGCRQVRQNYLVPYMSVRDGQSWVMLGKGTGELVPWCGLWWEYYSAQRLVGDSEEENRWTPWGSELQGWGPGHQILHSSVIFCHYF